MDTATKTAIDAAKIVSKGVVQKTAEATEDLIVNKIADKVTSVGKTKKKEKEDEINKIQEIYIPSEKKTAIIDNLRLFQIQYKNVISKSYLDNFHFKIGQIFMINLGHTISTNE